MQTLSVTRNRYNFTDARGCASSRDGNFIALALNRKEPQSVRLPPQQPGTRGCACCRRCSLALSRPRQQKPRASANPLPPQSGLTPRLGAPAAKRPRRRVSGRSCPTAGSQTGPGQPHRRVSDRAGPAPPKERNRAHKTLRRFPAAGAAGQGLRWRLAALAIGCAAANQRARCRRRPCAGRAGNRSSGKGAPVMAAAVLGVASPCSPSVRRLLSFAETERPEGCSVFLPPVIVSASLEAGALHCALVL